MITLLRRKSLHLERNFLTDTGWSRPALPPCASYWAPPSALVRLHCAPDPFPEDLPSYGRKMNVYLAGQEKNISSVSREKAKQSNPHPSCPLFHHPSFSHLTRKQKRKFSVYNLTSWWINEMQTKNIVPDSENTCRGSRPSDCSSLLESGQRGHIPWGQSRIWPVWVHPSPVHLPVIGKREQKITPKYLPAN